jgi:hypothetical protein
VPPKIKATGFQTAGMNGVYVVQWDKPKNGVPTLWQPDGRFMIYWCTCHDVMHVVIDLLACSFLVGRTQCSRIRVSRPTNQPLDRLPHP